MIGYFQLTSKAALHLIHSVMVLASNELTMFSRMVHVNMWNSEHILQTFQVQKYVAISYNVGQVKNLTC